MIAADSGELHRPTFARVDSAAIAANFRAFQKHAPGVKIMAVVKADAYGHGLLSCARIFSDLHADYFGVGFVEEGHHAAPRGTDASRFSCWAASSARRFRCFWNTTST